MINIKFKPKNVFIFLGIIMVILGALHLLSTFLATHYGLSESQKMLASRFDLNEEISLPTWYEQTLLLIVSLVALIIGMQKYSAKVKYAKHWLGIGFIFLFLSIDEGSSFHEILMPAIKNTFKSSELFNSYFYYAWVIVGFIFVAIVALIYFKFWLNLPSKTRWLTLTSAIIFVGGSMGVEMISGDYFSVHGYTFAYAILNFFEEMMEGFGAILFIYTLLNYASKNKIKGKFEIKS